MIHFILFHYGVSQCLGTGWFSTSHGGCWPLPDVVPCLSVVICTHAKWSYTREMCQFACGVNVVLATNFVGKFIWFVGIDFVYLTSGSLMTDVSTPFHVVCLQLK